MKKATVVWLQKKKQRMSGAGSPASSLRAPLLSGISRSISSPDGSLSPRVSHQTSSRLSAQTSALPRITIGVPPMMSPRPSDSTPRPFPSLNAFNQGPLWSNRSSQNRTPREPSIEENLVKNRNESSIADHRVFTPADEIQARADDRILGSGLSQGEEGQAAEEESKTTSFFDLYTATDIQKAMLWFFIGSIVQIGQSAFQHVARLHVVRSGDLKVHYVMEHHHGESVSSLERDIMEHNYLHAKHHNNLNASTLASNINATTLASNATLGNSAENTTTSGVQAHIQNTTRMADLFSAIGHNLLSTPDGRYALQASSNSALMANFQSTTDYYAGLIGTVCNMLGSVMFLYYMRPDRMMKASYYDNGNSKVPPSGFFDRHLGTPLLVACQLQLMSAAFPLLAGLIQVVHADIIHGDTPFSDQDLKSWLSIISGVVMVSAYWFLNLTSYPEKMDIGEGWAKDISENKTLRRYLQRDWVWNIVISYLQFMEWVMKALSKGTNLFFSFGGGSNSYEKNSPGSAKKRLDHNGNAVVQNGEKTTIRVNPRASTHETLASGVSFDSLERKDSSNNSKESTNSLLSSNDGFESAAEDENSNIDPTTSTAVRRQYDRRRKTQLLDLQRASDLLSRREKGRKRLSYLTRYHLASPTMITSWLITTAMVLATALAVVPPFGYELDIFDDTWLELTDLLVNVCNTIGALFFLKFAYTGENNLLEPLYFGIYRNQPKKKLIAKEGKTNSYYMEDPKEFAEHPMNQANSSSLQNANLLGTPGASPRPLVLSTPNATPRPPNHGNNQHLFNAFWRDFCEETTSKNAESKVLMISAALDAVKNTFASALAQGGVATMGRTNSLTRSKPAQESEENSPAVTANSLDTLFSPGGLGFAALVCNNTSLSHHWRNRKVIADIEYLTLGRGALRKTRKKKKTLNYLISASEERLLPEEECTRGTHLQNTTSGCCPRVGGKILGMVRGHNDDSEDHVHDLERIKIEKPAEEAASLNYNGEENVKKETAGKNKAKQYLSMQCSFDVRSVGVFPLACLFRSLEFRSQDDGVVDARVLEENKEADFDVIYVQKRAQGPMPKTESVSLVTMREEQVRERRVSFALTVDSVSAASLSPTRSLGSGYQYDLYQICAKCVL